MSQTTTYISCLLMTLIATLHLGTCWDEYGINEQFYSLSAIDATGRNIPMSTYVGKVLLIVNVASECGYTHTHYHDLVKLQRNLEHTGLFHVLAFPCNQFGQQEPKDISKIVKFASDEYHVNFQLFDKVDVIGDESSPLWTFLIEQTGQAPQWNFWKYLIDHRGNVIGPWGPKTGVYELSPVVKKAVAEAQNHATASDAAHRHPNVIKEL